MLRFYLYVFVSRSQKMVGGDVVEKGTGVLARSAFLDVPFGFLGFYATMLLSV